MTAIIFDLGGVFVNDIWEPLCIGPGGIAEKYNLPRKEFEEFTYNINRRFGALTPKETGDWQKAEFDCWSEIIREFAPYFPSQIKPSDLFEMTDDFIEPLNQHEMATLALTLREQGIETGVCSDVSSFIFHRLNKKLHLENLFEPKHIVTSFEVGELKMNGFRMFESVVAALGVNKEDCLFFDDRIVNISKARSFGMMAVEVPPDLPETVEVIRTELKTRGILRK